MQYLKEFHRDGRTIVMVTHDKETASYADRTIRLVEGVLERDIVEKAA